VQLDYISSAEFVSGEKSFICKISKNYDTNTHMHILATLIIY